MRYERLITLVSEGSKEDVLGEMSPSDSTALAELQALLHGLDTGTALFYVAGGEDTLARWVSSLICRHVAESAATQHALLDDESARELFFRRVGVNVYAAQVLAATTQGDGGLAAFVSMSAQERMARYGTLVGGEALERVNAIIGTRW